MFSVNKRQSIHSFQAGDWDFLFAKIGKKVTYPVNSVGKGAEFWPLGAQKKNPWIKVFPVHYMGSLCRTQGFSMRTTNTLIRLHVCTG